MMTIFLPIVSQNYLIHSLKSVILSWRISVCDNNYMYPCFHVSFKYHVESYLITKNLFKKKHFVITENCVLNARVIINASKAHGTREPMENIFIYTNLPSQVTHKWEKVRERERVCDRVVLKINDSQNRVIFPQVKKILFEVKLLETK